MVRRQVFGFVGAGLMVLGSVMPFAQERLVSHSLVQGEHGVFFLGVAVVAALFIALRWNLLALIAAVLGGFAFLAEAMEVWNLKSSNQGLDGGAYLMGLGVVTVVVSAWAGGLLPSKAPEQPDSSETVPEETP